MQENADMPMIGLERTERVESELVRRQVLMKHHAKGPAALSLASMWVCIAACDVAAEVDPKASVGAHSAASVVVEPDAEAQVDATNGVDAFIEPRSFDLETVAKLVRKGDLESAAELEAIINDETRGHDRLDIDADGKVDRVQVVEVEVEAEGDAADDDAEAVFELRVIPSSKPEVEAGVTFATLTFVRHPVNSEVEITARFTAVVRGHEAHVYTYVVPVRIETGVIVDGNAFLAWVYATERGAGNHDARSSGQRNEGKRK